MGVIRSILLLAGVVCSVVFAYFVGHALSVGGSKPYVMAAVLLAVGVILLTIYHRTSPADAPGGADH
jgi:hypothetical protein